MSEFVEINTKMTISVKRSTTIGILNFQRNAVAKENEKMRNDYLNNTSDMLMWIESTIKQLDDRVFANSLVGVQQQLMQFAKYQVIEKRPKFAEKVNLEVLLWTLQAKMRANHQKTYIPKGKMISDLNNAWERLEKSEDKRELALREEIIRQKMLEKLAARVMRETWLYEQKAIEIDVYAYEERIYGLVNLCDVLQSENYHDMDRIIARKDNILWLYSQLLELLRVEEKLRKNYQKYHHMVEDIR